MGLLGCNRFKAPFGRLVLPYREILMGTEDFVSSPRGGADSLAMIRT